ncbi:MAG TPA: hypothetical protein VFW25_11025 [Silvibacterium sp.]|nr:hypothetical protein [Silvibacterium sp.]
MRALKIVCGIAVLLVAIHMVHGIHHVVSQNGGPWTAAMWALVIGAAIVDVLAFVGGVLLLRTGN